MYEKKAQPLCYEHSTCMFHNQTSKKERRYPIDPPISRRAPALGRPIVCHVGIQDRRNSVQSAAQLAKKGRADSKTFEMERTLLELL